MSKFDTPSSRWQALVTRDPAANGLFVYCVLTTHIYCRPTCSARLARRANVTFFSTSFEAEAAGYRACKRCRPDLPTHSPETDKINAVCQKLKGLKPGQQVPKLEDMATLAGLTKSHFHRSFKRVVGMTPKAYLEMILRERDVSTASPSTMTDPPSSEWLSSVLSMSSEGTPRTSCNLAPSDELLLTNRHQPGSIHYAITSTTLGTLSVAFSNGDICMLDLCDTAEEALACLKRAFEPAFYDLVPLSTTDAEHASLIKKLNAVVEALERPSGKTMFLPHQVIIMGQQETQINESESTRREY